MKTLKKLCLGAALATVLTSKSWAVDVATVSLPTAVTDKQLTIGKRSLKLPSGDWQLVARTQGAVTNLATNSKLGDRYQAYAVRMVNGIWRGAVYFSAPDYSVRTESWAHEPCKDDSNIFKDDFNSGFKLPECLLVKKRNSHLNNPTAQTYKNAVDWFKQNNIPLPAGGVYEVAYYRYATNTHATVIVFLPQSQTAGDEPVIAWAKGLPDRIRRMAEGRDDDAVLPELPVKE